MPDVSDFCCTKKFAVFRVLDKVQKPYPIHLPSNIFRGFPLEQSPLAVDAPGIARERSVMTHHTVAGDGEREVVRRTCAGDGSHGFWRADALRNFGVRDRRANGNFLQRLPYTLLENCTANVEREIQAYAWCLNEPDNPRDHSLVIL